jgi:hypothetical protein
MTARRPLPNRREHPTQRVVPHILQALAMEPANRIERTTCGLRISDSPTSDNLTPQETTNQDAPDMGDDGGELSCPGGSVVAILRNEDEL